MSFSGAPSMSQECTSFARTSGQQCEHLLMLSTSAAAPNHGCQEWPFVCHPHDCACSSKEGEVTASCKASWGSHFAALGLPLQPRDTQALLEHSHQAPALKFSLDIAQIPKSTFSRHRSLIYYYVDSPHVEHKPKMLPICLLTLLSAASQNISDKQAQSPSRKTWAHT